MKDRDVLAFDPFAGDRDSDVTLLRDRMVVARYSHECNTCGGVVAPKTRVRARSEIYEGHGCTVYFCADCCAAMAKSWRDGGKAIEARYEMYPTNPKKKRVAA